MLLNNAQTLLDQKNIINEIVIRTDDYTKAEEYAAQIESISGYRTESWQESQRQLPEDLQDPEPSSPTSSPARCWWWRRSAC